MSLENLREVKHPSGPRVCVACKCWTAECHAPVGEGSAVMCWLCAHQVVDHDVPLHEAMNACCECTPDQVYPKAVLERRAALTIGQHPLMQKAFEIVDSEATGRPDRSKTR